MHIKDLCFFILILCIGIPCFEFYSIAKRESGNEDSKSNKVLVCFVDLEEGARRERYEFLVEHIRPELCTHIIFSYAIISENFTLDYRYPQIVKDNDFFMKLVNLREENKDLKLLLSVSEKMNEERFIYMNNQEQRTTFIESALQFLKENDFNGIDIEWQVADDNINYDTLKLIMSDFNKKFKSQELMENNYTLTVTIPGSVYRLKEHYHAHVLKDYVDLYLIKSNHFYGPWDGKVSALTPINEIEKGIKYLLEQVDSEKVALGATFYGQTYQLNYALSNEDVLPFRYGCEKQGFKGPVSNVIGSVGYFEICRHFYSLNNYKPHFDNKTKTAYLLSPEKDRVITFENNLSLEEKVELAKKYNLGGMMVNGLELDDFTGLFCESEGFWEYNNEHEYPLLRIVYNALYNTNSICVSTTPITTPETTTITKEESIPTTTVSSSTLIKKTNLKIENKSGMPDQTNLYLAKSNSLTSKSTANSCNMYIIIIGTVLFYSRIFGYF